MSDPTPTADAATPDPATDEAPDRDATPAATGATADDASTSRVPDVDDAEADEAGTDGATDGGAPEAGTDGAQAAADAVAPLGTFVVVEVVNVAFELPSPHPMLHLLERETPFRGLDFPIGLPEAQSIAYALEREQAPRPTTHDLVVALLGVAGCEVVAVRLIGERGGTLLAELDLMGPKGHEVLDCRPSDGIAIALRLAVPAPILCEAGLLDG